MTARAIAQKKVVKRNREGYNSEIRRCSCENSNWHYLTLVPSAEKRPMRRQASEIDAFPRLATPPRLLDAITAHEIPRFHVVNAARARLNRPLHHSTFSAREREREVSLERIYTWYIKEIIILILILNIPNFTCFFVAAALINDAKSKKI